ncbi:MAG: BACON domain-containing carbohydrate-binding protein, partial [Bacteroidales bacterium]|nr:BACON domain-containing carbohydrate-binding protein [Bacteroidales bacterium]
MKLIKNILIIGLVLLSLSSCKKDPPPVLTISVQNLSLGNISPSETISVESNYPWKLTCDASWISFTPSTGDGNATVTITAQDNLTEDERNANLIFTIGKEGSSTFLRKVVRATQSFPQLNLDIELLSFEKDNSTKSFTVNSNTSWSVEVSSGASWITSNKTS